MWSAPRRSMRLRSETRESLTELDTNHTNEDQSNPTQRESVQASLSGSSFDSRLLRSRSSQILEGPFDRGWQEATATALDTRALPKRKSRCSPRPVRPRSASDSI